MRSLKNLGLMRTIIKQKSIHTDSTITNSKKKKNRTTITTQILQMKETKDSQTTHQTDDNLGKNYINK